MDKLTHLSITNCLKELAALEALVASEKYSYEEIASWVSQVGWELSNIFQRVLYNSDEFQFRLRQLVHTAKKEKVPTGRKDDVSMTTKESDGYNCAACDCWIQDTGNWFCEECDVPTCERCGKLDHEEEVFLCPECFSVPKGDS